jgi:hypothetical protein
MWRLLSMLVIPLLCACGGITLQGGFHPTTVTSSGLVSFVQFTSASDGNGSLVSVTIVTLAAVGGTAGSAETLTLCGNHGPSFPLNTFVRMSFRPGPGCGTLLSVSTLQRG